MIKITNSTKSRESNQSQGLELTSNIVMKSVFYFRNQCLLPNEYNWGILDSLTVYCAVEGPLN